MTSDGDTSRALRSLDKGRLESFSDGVFGFAATLLVADIALHPPGSALEQVLRAWPSYLAYVVSFLTIGAAWLAHTALTDRLARADRILLRLNLLVLLVVVFLPFPTRLVAGAAHHTGSERVFVTMLGLNCWRSAPPGSAWTRMPAGGTSTHPKERARSCRANNENCCPLSPGTWSRSSSGSLCRTWAWRCISLLRSTWFGRSGGSTAPVPAFTVLASERLGRQSCWSGGHPPVSWAQSWPPSRSMTRRYAPTRPPVTASRKHVSAAARRA